MQNILRSLYRYLPLACGCLASAFAASAQTTTEGMPRLEKRGDAVTLMVDNQPYLILGGELHNSSASTLAYMQGLWPRLEAAHLNTVLAPVYWELTEPKEGVFDFGLVDGIISQARQHGKHLVLLWFGSWKNGQSSYAPSWVKRDTARFPLARTSDGKPLQVLSPFSPATLRADSAAFGALMRHLRAFDGHAHTVLLVQVENEVGILGDTRDRSPLAETAFSRPVPAALTTYLKAHRDSLRPSLSRLWKAQGSRTEGSWKTVVGDSPATDELFMAWAYARFVGQVAAAGKAAYPIPLYANAWIVQPGDKLPGDYPSGGPQAHMHDLWKAAAPKIDILAPDIYLPDFSAVCRMYRETGKGFFIPESRGGTRGMANALFAFGAMDAIGYSPFGIDDPVSPEKDTLAQAYALLEGLAPEILRAQQAGRIAGVSLDEAHPADTVDLGGYRLEVTRLPATWDSKQTVDRGAALILADGPGNYYILGAGAQVVFFPPGGAGIAGLDRVEEGTFRDGRWQTTRILNGDETAASVRLGAMARESRTGMAVKLPAAPALLHVQVYRF